MTLRVLLISMLVAGAIVAPAGARAQPQDLDPERLAALKAAFVLNFARYTEWPAERFVDQHIEGEPELRLAPVIIGILGEDGRFEGSLRRLVRGDHIRERPIVVRHIRPPQPPPGERDIEPEAIERFQRRLREVHLLYITHDDRRRLPLRDVLDLVGDAAVLTVSDIRRFAEDGGMMGLVIRENRLAFDANLKAIERSRITISSRVLRLARIVDREEP